MDIVTLTKDGDKQEFSHEHAENILNHPINAKVEKKDKYKLPADSEWSFKDGKLKKKSK